MYLTYHTCFALSTFSLFFVILHIFEFEFLYILNVESSFFHDPNTKKEHDFSHVLRFFLSNTF